MKSPDDLIEQYLDELVAQLMPLGPRRLRQVLAETEAHLWMRWLKPSSAG